MVSLVACASAPCPGECGGPAPGPGERCDCVTERDFSTPNSPPSAASAFRRGQRMENERTKLELENSPIPTIDNDLNNDAVDSIGNFDD